MKRSPRSTRKLLDYKLLNSTGERVLKNLPVSSNQDVEDQSIDSPSVSSSVNEGELLVRSPESSAVLPFHDEQLAGSPQTGLPQDTDLLGGEVISQSLAHSPVSLSYEQSVSLSEDHCEVTSVTSSILESQESSFSDFLNQYSYQQQAKQASSNSFAALGGEVSESYRTNNLPRSNRPTIEADPTILPGIASWLRGLAYINSDQTMTHLPTLKVAQKALGQDIDDFLDENPVAECSTISEVEVSVGKVEEYRGLYRRKHGEYKTVAGEDYEESEGREFDDRLASMKAYILAGKKVKKGMIDELNDNSEPERKLRKQ